MSVFIHSRPCPSIWPYWQCFLPGPKATQGSRGEGKGKRKRRERYRAWLDEDSLAIRDGPS